MHAEDRLVSTPPPSFEPSGTNRRPDGTNASRVSGKAIPRAHGRRTKPDPSSTPPVIPPTGPKKPTATPTQGVHSSSRRSPANSHPTPAATQSTAAPLKASKKSRRHGVAVGLVLVLTALIAWPLGLLLWADGKITHTEALSDAEDTPGTTYLLVGSDSRADGTVTDGAEGQRSDTILILHKPVSGTTSLTSLPRDTYVEIEGYGPNKLNAAYAFGGAQLLVSTVEQLTGLTIDHYVEISMGGVVQIVDAVGGVELCLDYDVSDELSQLQWTAGCHEVDGTTALAFARMRYSDPLGDFGRQARQRQVISAVTHNALTPSLLLNPLKQVALVDAGVSTLTSDTNTGVIDLGRMSLAFIGATRDSGVSGTPPIANPDYQPGGVGSTVLLDPDKRIVFFQKIMDGSITQEDFQQFAS